MQKHQQLCRRCLDEAKEHYSDAARDFNAAVKEAKQNIKCAEGNNMLFNREVFIDYFNKKITKEELMAAIGLTTNNFHFHLHKAIENQLLLRDSQMLEFLIFALMLWESQDIPQKSIQLKYFENVLNELIICEWHEQHENIAMMIQKIGSADSVEFLYTASLLNLKYLEWDDNYSFQIKCIRAMSRIGGEKSKVYLKLLCDNGNSIISEMAKRQLNKLDT